MTEIKSGAVDGAMVEARKGMHVKINYGIPIRPNCGVIWKVLRDTLIIRHKDGSSVLVSAFGCILLHAPLERGDEMESNIERFGWTHDGKFAGNDLDLRMLAEGKLRHRDKAMRDAPDYEKN